MHILNCMIFFHSIQNNIFVWLCNHIILYVLDMFYEGHKYIKYIYKIKKSEMLVCLETVVEVVVCGYKKSWCSSSPIVAQKWEMHCKMHDTKIQKKKKISQCKWHWYYLKTGWFLLWLVSVCSTYWWPFQFWRGSHGTGGAGICQYC